MVEIQKPFPFRQRPPRDGEDRYQQRRLWRQRHDKHWSSSKIASVVVYMIVSTFFISTLLSSVVPSLVPFASAKEIDMKDNGDGTTDRQIVTDLIDWLTTPESQGGGGGYFNSKQQVRPIFPGSTITGIFAVETIEEGELLTSIPWNAIVSPLPPPPTDDENVAEDDDEDDDDDEEDTETIPEMKQLSCGTLLALQEEFLLAEQSNYQSYLSPYVRSLQTQQNKMGGKIPSAYSRGAKYLLEQILGNEGMIVNGRRPSKRIVGSKSMLADSPARLPPFDATQWLEVMYELCGNDTEWRLFSSSSKKSSSKSIDIEYLTVLLITRSDYDIMVPVYDFYNHNNHPKKYNTYGQFESGIKHDTYAKRRIEAGEEILLSYNLCSECDARIDTYGTASIFCDYGFVESMPQRWYFFGDKLRLDLQEQEEEEELTSNDTKNSDIVDDESKATLGASSATALYSLPSLASIEATWNLHSSFLSREVLEIEQYLCTELERLIRVRIRHKDNGHYQDNDDESNEKTTSSSSNFFIPLAKTEEESIWMYYDALVTAMSHGILGLNNGKIMMDSIENESFQKVAEETIQDLCSKHVGQSEWLYRTNHYRDMENRIVEDGNPDDNEEKGNENNNEDSQDDDDDGDDDDKDNTNLLHLPKLLTGATVVPPKRLQVPWSQFMLDEYEKVTFLDDEDGTEDEKQDDATDDDGEESDSSYHKITQQGTKLELMYNQYDYYYTNDLCLLINGDRPICKHSMEEIYDIATIYPSKFINPTTSDTRFRILIINGDNGLLVDKLMLQFADYDMIDMLVLATDREVAETSSEFFDINPYLPPIDDDDDDDDDDDVELQHVNWWFDDIQESLFTLLALRIAAAFEEEQKRDGDVNNDDAERDEDESDPSSETAGKEFDMIFIDASSDPAFDVWVLQTIVPKLLDDETGIVTFIGHDVMSTMSGETTMTTGTSKSMNDDDDKKYKYTSQIRPKYQFSSIVPIPYNTYITFGSDGINFLYPSILYEHANAELVRSAGTERRRSPLTSISFPTPAEWESSTSAELLTMYVDEFVIDKKDPWEVVDAYRNNYDYSDEDDEEEDEDENSSSTQDDIDSNGYCRSSGTSSDEDQECQWTTRNDDITEMQKEKELIILKTITQQILSSFGGIGTENDRDDDDGDDDGDEGTVDGDDSIVTVVVICGPKPKDEQGNEVSEAAIAAASCPSLMALQELQETGTVPSSGVSIEAIPLWDCSVTESPEEEAEDKDIIFKNVMNDCEKQLMEQLMTKQKQDDDNAGFRPVDIVMVDPSASYRMIQILDSMCSSIEFWYHFTNRNKNHVPENGMIFVTFSSDVTEPAGSSSNNNKENNIDDSEMVIPSTKTKTKTTTTTTGGKMWHQNFLKYLTHGTALLTPTARTEFGIYERTLENGDGNVRDVLLMEVGTAQVGYEYGGGGGDYTLFEEWYYFVNALSETFAELSFSDKNHDDEHDDDEDDDDDADDDDDDDADEWTVYIQVKSIIAGGPTIDTNV